MGSLNDVTGDRDLTTLTVGEILELHAAASREAIKGTLDRINAMKAEVGELGARLEAQNHALERIQATIGDIGTRAAKVTDRPAAAPVAEPARVEAQGPEREPDAKLEGASGKGHGKKPATHHDSKPASQHDSDRAER